MRLFHKILIAAALLLLGISLISFRSDSDDLFWYVDGQPYYWETQQDVYAFRLKNDETAKFEISNPTVDRVQFRSDKKDKIQLVYFKENSSEFERQEVIGNIETSYNFDVSFPVITLFPNLTYKRAMWFVADDQLMVTFKENAIDSNGLQQFEIKHNLLCINKPYAMDQAHDFYTYIFKIDPQELVFTNAIQLARSIYIEESALIENIQPNLINAYEEDNQSSVDSTVATSVETSITEKKENKFYLVKQSRNQIQVSINWEEDMPFQYSMNIYDLTGKKLFTKRINQQQIQFNLDLSAYPNGLYIANLEAENGLTVKQQKFRKY